MDSRNLDQASAKRLINSLKKGTTPLDMAIHLNVGNDHWYSAAEEFCSDVETDGDSIVRFINGYYGDGKTHFLGILRFQAMLRGWMVSYVTLENTPIHKFDVLYGEIVKNVQIPGSVPLVSWLPESSRRGSAALLSAFFSKWYSEASGSLSKDGLKRMGVIQGVKDRTDRILARLGVHELVAKAVQAFVASALSDKIDQLKSITAWAEGQPVIPRELGITRRIDGNLARDFLRSFALLARNSGIKGSLILLDEAERIMDQSHSVRKKSYGVIRDFLDNADEQGGMPSSMIYIAATPEMFSSQKGFAEYDALRSRLANTQRFSIPKLMDWRAVIVDLVKTPLPHDHLIQLAVKVRDIHSIARQWDPRPHFSEEIIQKLVSKIESSASAPVSKPRMLSSLVATLLEIAEQNPGRGIHEVVDGTFEQVLRILISRPEANRWE